MRVDAAMPGVGTGLGDDVYDRPGITPVLRPELVGDKNVLLNKFGVGNEQAGAADAVIIIVLSVDLLVIVAPAQTVHGKSGAAVGVGKPVVARATTPGTNSARLSRP